MSRSEYLNDALVVAGDVSDDCAVLAATPVLYRVLKYLGALYLTYLAWKIATSEPHMDEAKSGGKPITFIEAALFPKPKENRKPSNVLLFSLEMPARELALRLLCSRARVNMQKLRTAHPDERMQMDLVQAANEYKGLPLVVDDNGGQNILEIRAKCRRVHARTPLDLVVIDYIQLINGLDSGLPREQQIAEVSRSIKAMAKEFGIPIIALAQLNRKSEDEARQPKMSDLRESGSIEQDADIVMLISRPNMSQSKAAEAEAEQMGQDGCFARQLIVAKNRNGPTDDIDLLWNPGLTRFETPAKQQGDE